MRLKACWAAIGGALALAAAVPAPAQAHVLTCANARAVTLQKLHAMFDVSAGPITLRVTRLGSPCRLGPVSRVGGVNHRHWVYWDFEVYRRLQGANGEVDQRHLRGTTKLKSLTRGVFVLDILLAPGNLMGSVPGLDPPPG